MSRKKLVLVAAPPGCGKTYYSGLLASRLGDCVCLDLDLLNPLSFKLCDLCGQERDKGGAFFRENVRDAEYETLLDFAFFALQHSSAVIVAAPFTKEFRNAELLDRIRRRAGEADAELVPVWILSSPEACRQNMLEREASRDRWKLADFEKYLAGIRMEPPEGVNDLTVIDAHHRENAQTAIEPLLQRLQNQI